jgi:hypothetical protein
MMASTKNIFTILLSVILFNTYGPNLEETSTNPILQTPPISTVAPFELTSSEIKKDGGSFMSHSLSGEMRSQFLRGPEPQTTVLEKSSISSSEPVPETYHTNLPGVLTSRITKHHSTAPRAQITPNLSTKQSLRDGLAEEHSYSQDKYFTFTSTLMGYIADVILHFIITFIMKQYSSFPLPLWRILQIKSCISSFLL